MVGMMIEIVIMAFVMGGIIGAVTALHLSKPEVRESQTREFENLEPARIRVSRSSRKPR